MCATFEFCAIANLQQNRTVMCFFVVRKLHSDNKNLVGGFNHLEKYESMGRIIPYIIEHKIHV